MTALHYSWLSPGGSLANTDMEETYLYHKLEAMRHVNELVADPEMCTTDECIGLIAALAMAEVCIAPFSLCKDGLLIGTVYRAGWVISPRRKHILKDSLLSSICDVPRSGSTGFGESSNG